VIDSLAKKIFFALFLFAAAAAGASQPFPAGSAQAPAIRFQFAVYYPAPPSTEPLAALRSLARAWPQLTMVDGPLPETPTGTLISARMIDNVRKHYPAPDVASLKYFGRGLSAAQINALQGARQALVIDFGHPKQETMAALRNATTLAAQVAAKTGGLLWDEETREVFTPEKWRELRLSAWTGGVPDISSQIAVHAYRHGELVRAVSLGMVKFGLPDLAADQYPWSSSKSMGSLINLLAQALAEGAVIGRDGRIDLDIRKIAHPKVRARLLEGVKENAQSTGKLILMNAAREQGDPENRIASINFARYPGPDNTARQEAMLSAMFGSSDGIKYIKHNDELEQASALARKKLTAMEADFKRGLRPGEYLQAKAPFPTPAGGNEWMWVEITKWDGDRIDGLLQNDPYDIPAMKAGQSVRIKLSEVFDYIRVHPDGHREGNTTGAIIEKMQGNTRN
jgi:uncharacterized protein YegJ (DUF2314 family)